MKTAVLFLLPFFFCANAAAAQSLHEAAKEYSSSKHYEYEAAFISNEKIKSILEYTNTRGKEYKRKESHFNSFGKPISVKTYDIYGDSTVYDMQYDAYGNLLSKSVKTRSRCLTYQYTTTEIHQWNYGEKGELSSYYKYELIDFIPSEKGGWGIPAELMCTQIESYSYDSLNKQVHISNKGENAAYKLYPPMQKIERSASLRFHPNGKLAEMSQHCVNNGQATAQVKKYDKQGKEINPVSQALSPKDWVFPPAYMALEKGKILKIDSLREGPNAPLELCYTLSSGNGGVEEHCLYYSKEGHLLRSAQQSFTSLSKSKLLSYIKKSYNGDDLVEQEYFTSADSPLNFSGYHNSQGYHKPGDLYGKTLFEYYENGLLKRQSSFDKWQKLVQSVWYEVIKQP